MSLEVNLKGKIWSLNGNVITGLGSFFSVLLFGVIEMTPGITPVFNVT